MWWCLLNQADKQVDARDILQQMLFFNTSSNASAYDCLNHEHPIHPVRATPYPANVEYIVSS